MDLAFMRHVRQSWALWGRQTSDVERIKVVRSELIIHANQNPVHYAMRILIGTLRRVGLI